MDYKEKVIALLNSQELSKEQKEKLESIFPELKESKDERIRKALIKGFNKLDKSAVWYNGITNGQILAWLEKQKEVYDNGFHDGYQFGIHEEKPFKWTKHDEAVRKEAISCLKYWKNIIPNGSAEDYKNILYWLENELSIHTEKQGEQKVPDVAVVRKELNEHLKPLGEQKPAEWSEEDKIALGDALWCCKQAASIAKDENDMGNVWYAERWLKSLKDRVQPQLKQEWSKEDENRINRLIAYFEDKESFTAEDDVMYANWLKSLRPQPKQDLIFIDAERVKDYLPPHWKPSKEQLNELCKVITNTGFNPYVIESLYDNLKKLREE